MSLLIGRRVKLDRHTWVVQKIVGNFCSVYWNGHVKNMAVVTIEAILAGPAKRQVKHRVKKAS